MPARNSRKNRLHNDTTHRMPLKSRKRLMYKYLRISSCSRQMIRVLWDSIQVYRTCVNRVLSFLSLQ
jgi:hypothetical protein